MQENPIYQCGITKEWYYVEKPRGKMVNISPPEVPWPKTIGACGPFGFWPWVLPRGYIHPLAFPHNVGVYILQWQCTVYRVHLTVNRAVYSVQYTAYSVQFTVYSIMWRGSQTEILQTERQADQDLSLTLGQTHWGVACLREYYSWSILTFLEMFLGILTFL